MGEKDTFSDIGQKPDVVRQSEQGAGLEGAAAPAPCSSCSRAYITQPLPGAAGTGASSDGPASETDGSASSASSEAESCAGSGSASCKATTDSASSLGCSPSCGGEGRDVPS
jgi:hypothetical protein